MSSPLTQSITTLHGVGPKLTERLTVLGIVTLGDALRYLPREHDDRSQLTAIVDIQADQAVTISGIIDRIALRRIPRRKVQLVEAVVTDETGSIAVTWFNQAFIVKNLKVGDRVNCNGSTKLFRGRLVLQNPTYEKSFAGSATSLHTGRLVPEYPLTAGVTQKQLRYVIKQALDACLPLPESLPATICQQYHLLYLTDALRQVHWPDSPASFEQAMTRLIFEDLYITQLAVQSFRQTLHSEIAPALKIHTEELQAFVKGLPFKLTNSQRKAAWEILQQMEHATPMNRLLHGDVGAGKTIVAALALFNTARAGYQGVVMVPTEILAQQHAASLKTILEPYGITVELRTGGMAKQQTEQLFTPDVIVGTHALIQPTVHFRKLGLVVIDEQHRFGVGQRKILRNSSGDGLFPHFLSMTATPIPRTLALTWYGDLDISTIPELPPGRKTVITKFVKPAQREDAYAFLKQRMLAGEQVFVLCPLVEKSDSLNVKAATTEYEKLQRIFPEFKLGLIHGKLKSQEKTAIMTAMKQHAIDLLVATSVIEVGVDIPNATVMMIEGADRFGVAQLHQFRGLQTHLQ